MVNLHELTVFLIAARSSSFSEAGRQLHLSQPAISQMIDGLEKRYGVKLFSRQGRYTRLTEAGEKLLPLASELMASAHYLEDTIYSLQGEVYGDISVRCSTTSGKYKLPGLAARFRERFPQMKIKMLVASSSLNLGRVIEVKISEMCLNHTIHMTRSRRFIPSRAHKEFWNFAKEEAPGLYSCNPLTLS
jgi:DNA-binding transcriptional LysR family regulator